MEKFGKVGVFLGGRSHERAISLKSGGAVYQALKEAGVDVIKIDTANGFRSQIEREPIGLAFIALHGAGGEDGTIQTLLGRKRIFYTGSEAKASAVAFDKARAKHLFRRFGIPTPRYQIVDRHNWREAMSKWKPPYVVKPVQEGSSIGVFFVEHKGKAAKKVVRSLIRYPQLLFEEKIEGREYTVGILGRRALPVIELKPKRAFYDFKAKYTKGLTQYLVPAPISEKLAKHLQTIALKVHGLLELRDLSRTDFKVDARGNPFVLEINSIPGFTETSLLPKAAQRIGIDFTELCLRLLGMANERRLKEESNGKAQRKQI